MKQIALLLLLFSSFTAQSQDTLSLIKRYQGGETILLVSDQDTFFQSFYPNGELESIRPYTRFDDTTIYKRFYENGKPLWHRQMKNGMANGTTVFFNERGKAMASLVFKNDTMIDTNYISQKHHFVYGRGTYYHVVHGGMQREDGSSNISGGHGIFMYAPMKSVRFDAINKQVSIYKEFYTDFNGFYFICLERGKFGLYQGHQDLKSISFDLEMIQSVGSGIQSSWSGGPIFIKDENLHLLNLHSHSVGYAP